MTKTMDDQRYWDERGLLLIGFSFATGIAVYSGLPNEPYWPLLVSCFLLAGVFLFAASRSGKAGKVSFLLIAFLGGVTAGAVRTAYVDAPRIGETMMADLTGYVVDRQLRETGARILLQISTVDEIPRATIDFPKKVRLRVPGEPVISVGDKVEVRARLFPPSGPIAPGGYDFSFRAYYKQIGATGFSFGPAAVIENEGIPYNLKVASFVQGIRDGVAHKVASILGSNAEAALATALLVGDRSGIKEENEDDLRAAGLAHILAISGLHMALFAGGTYGMFILLLAMFPKLPLRISTHKLAAIAALFAAVIYLLLSGASVATQRSFLMIALVFLGVLTGRKGLTLRSVAIAGLVLLLLAPERLFFPGFQMSFAAVICLVAIYELWRSRKRYFDRGYKTETSLSARILGSAGRWVAGLLVTAFIAGLATGIIGAYHFGRVAPFGMIGNLLGMPVFSLVVMPMGVLALVLMPFGLAAFPLTIMSAGLSLILEIAAFTSALSGDTGAVGLLGASGALLLISALFAVLLLPGWMRLTAVVPFIAAVIVIDSQEPPDIQIAEAGSRIAARDGDGLLKWSGNRRSFGIDVWMNNEGVSEEKIISHKMKSPQRTCDEDGCVIRAYPGGLETEPGFEAEAMPLTVAISRSVDALQTDCLYADIIVSDFIVSDSCDAALVIDKNTRNARGAVSIWISAENGNNDEFSELQSGLSSESATGNIHITKISYAIPVAVRPWHRTGEVTRSSMRRLSNIE